MLTLERQASAYSPGRMTTFAVAGQQFLCQYLSNTLRLIRFPLRGFSGYGPTAAFRRGGFIRWWCVSGRVRTGFGSKRRATGPVRGRVLSRVSCEATVRPGPARTLGACRRLSTSQVLPGARDRTGQIGGRTGKTVVRADSSTKCIVVPCGDGSMPLTRSLTPPSNRMVVAASTTAAVFLQCSPQANTSRRQAMPGRASGSLRRSQADRKSMRSASFGSQLPNPTRTSIPTPVR